MRSTSAPEWTDFFTHQGMEVIETPLAWVIHNQVDFWKIRKPLTLEFLDWSTPSKRKEVCEQEIENNLLLAPQVYRGAVPLRRSPQGDFHFGPEGEIVDWATHMVRQPRHHRADVRMARGELTHDHLNLIAAQLNAFHRRPLDWSEKELSTHLQHLQSELQGLIELNRGYI
ncbi:MAG: hypothetical protein JRC77_09040, partial [Deltaproteobacteria bacterium]|nr:hypothetical protein [Deltaproteobacteria bacterium]